MNGNLHRESFCVVQYLLPGSTVFIFLLLVFLNLQIRVSDSFMLFKWFWCHKQRLFQICGHLSSPTLVSCNRIWIIAWSIRRLACLLKTLTVMKNKTKTFFLFVIKTMQFRFRKSGEYWQAKTKIKSPYSAVPRDYHYQYFSIFKKPLFVVISIPIVYISIAICKYPHTHNVSYQWLLICTLHSLIIL